MVVDALDCLVGIVFEAIQYGAIREGYSKVIQNVASSSPGVCSI
jgi:hypothetical protein